ncbi:MAG: Gfo/Idh/MocA family oxidoreductase [Bryobacteraceae bacterium]|nr:Gfo/Idh/MocA family oxidoreductase [Bryobacterales bacterium]MEB2363954.1 Gfo/Idh/MocA family oxidoreductase [Bryobacterales bacterium]NUM99509.1 Gfo/Idh/MocA family oxidoreductase [Bryobacteraceae bacterium]
MAPLQAALIGGGMIAHDQILPSLYQLQRQGVIGEISVCATEARFLKSLLDSENISKAFPGQSFRPFPNLSDTGVYLDLYKQVIAGLPPRNIVAVAVPDQLHYAVIMEALRHDQHVLTVKPLVLTAAEAAEIEQEASRRGLLVGIEYHKRFDDRSLMARRRYREGWFGEFRLGTACLLEKWYYRHSNFQNWCTVENSDAFTYIGCHYVDLVHFITGLLPVSVSVYGIKDRYPNGNEGFLWTDARVLWNNGASLNVQNALGFPDDAPGSNTQGMVLYCSGQQKGGLLAHSDQYRGLEYSYVRPPEGPGATVYAEPSPDYFQYVDLGGGGLVPVGYGYRSVDFIIRAAVRLESQAGTLEERRQMLRQFDEEGVMATPANSRYNELVIEAGRLSILNGGREVRIQYEGEPAVALA